MKTYTAYIGKHSATPIYRSGPSKGKPANVPDHPPPPGYICYRCGEKGHWIQVCPTNDDPAYENRPRVKRTTGIPRSFLKTVEKPIALANDGTTDEMKQPAGIMVNAEGEWVIAEPDKAAWEQYQAKARVSAAAQEAAKQGDKQLQERGLECSIDKHLFVDPTKTPCCQTTFCHDCITNALIENDLRCPKCSTENILIDDLVPDQEMGVKVHDYGVEKATVNARLEDPKSPVDRQQKASKSPSASFSVKPSSPPKDQVIKNNPRKRPAESELTNGRIQPAPNEKAPQNLSVEGTSSNLQGQTPVIAASMPANPETPFSNGNFSIPQNMNAMTFPGMTNFLPIGMTIDPVVGVNPAFQNPLMMNGSFIGSDWNMWGGGYHQQPMNMQGGSFQNSMMPNNPYSQQSNFMNMGGLNGTSMNGMGPNGRGINGQGRNSFANQQRTTFSAPSTNDEDSAYFRKPVNPHRHQARRNVQRPTDYREI